MARPLPASLAPVVEELELEQPRVVTLPQIGEIVARTTGGDPRIAAYELQRRGWLGRLRTSNAWEFLPGARAGAYGSGDRLIEVRAQLATKPGVRIAMAMESAAVLLRLAQRLPGREVVWIADRGGLPKALVEFRVVHLAMPDSAITPVDGLPVWTVEALLMGVATKPSSYRDLAGLAQWLPDAGPRVDFDLLVTCLEPANASSRQRAIYLLELANRIDLAERLARLFPPKVPVWFGAKRSGGRYDRLSQVLDSELLPLMSGGTGA
jgi:AbiEi antitoxin C-terminal domain